MAKKPKIPANDTKNQLRTSQSDYPNMSVDRAMAEIALSPIINNAQTSRIFSKGTFGDSDLTESVEAMREKVAKAQAGDLSGAEAMLTAQATALDAIFTEMARRAAMNMGEYLNAADTYMKLAFKAQSQCRMNLEALAEIKAPRAVAFVNQANIAHGHQQVNNGVESHARENVITPNELSGESDELRTHARASTPKSRVNPQVEAVGKVHRAED